MVVAYVPTQDQKVTYETLTYMQRPTLKAGWRLSPDLLLVASIHP
jgi:hypothetical protein